MIWSDYWGALSSRQRFGLIAGAVLIAGVTIGLAVWLLRDPYVPFAAGLSSERLKELTQELDRAKLDYRIGDSADALAVPRSQLGKARAATVGGDFGIPASVGLELFKESDFSSTDFAQRINYQRALQGELTRTILGIAGVRTARVHVILADGGLFKRNAAKASAAVTVALQEGKQLTAVQVRGIQRLVTGSVPDMKIDDVVVLDESGTSLTRVVSEGEGELSSGPLDLKRQADQYLESKLQRLLQELLPDGVATLSVDTVLDERQLRVTTEEPIPVRGPKDATHATGVLVKERQSQRGGAAGVVRTGGDAIDGDSTDWEYEYSVGRRVEQVLSAPGSIKHVSVAVALQGAPPELTVAAVEQLVANAIGIDRPRGDSVAVVLLPAATSNSNVPAELQPRHRIGPADVQPLLPVQSAWLATHEVIALLVILPAALLLLVWWAFLRPRDKSTAVDGAEIDIDATAAKVRQWLNGGSSNGRA